MEQEEQELLEKKALEQLLSGKSLFGKDGVIKRKLFDENYILIQEEYISGYASYYRIDKIENITNLN